MYVVLDLDTLVEHMELNCHPFLVDLLKFYVRGYAAWHQRRISLDLFTLASVPSNCSYWAPSGSSDDHDLDLRMLMSGISCS